MKNTYVNKVIILSLFVILSGCLDNGNGPSNNPPTVNLTANPAGGNAPLTVQFIANASDSDGSIKKYEWDFDNNGMYDTTVYVPDAVIAIYPPPVFNTASHTYESNGKYTPKVRVTDDSGATAEATASVNVNPAISFTLSGTPSANSVYLEKISANNDEITLGVNIKAGTDVYGAAIWLTYDGSKVKYLSANPSESYLVSNLSFSSALLNGQEGTLLLGIDKRGNAAGSNGDGVLLTIVFKALTVQSNTAINFNTVNSMLKSPIGNITGTNWLGGSLSYE